MPTGSIPPERPYHWDHLRSDHCSRCHYTSRHYTEHLRRIRFRDAESGQDVGVPHQPVGLPAATICALYKSRWQVELSSSGSSSISGSNGSSDIRKRGEDPNLDRRLGLRPRRLVKKRLNLDASLYTLLQILSVTLFEKIPISQALAQDDSKCSNFANN